MKVHSEASRSDRGATMVIVVVAMTALMGAAAFAIDIGSAWALRRDLIGATDAAALAAAADFAQGIDGCGATDDFYLAQNAPGATLVSCQASGNSSAGSVRISAEQEQTAYFGSVLGLADFDVPSFTGANWGYLSAGTGLRPFSLCAANVAGGTPPTWLTQLQAFVANPTPTPTTIEIGYGKDVQTDPCGTSGNPSNGAGNWGTVNLQRPVVCAPAWDSSHPCPNGNPGNSTLTAWTANGYERPIEPGTPGANCSSDSTHCWHGDTGADMNSGPVRGALNTLINDGTWFTLPLVDATTGNGSNLKFHIFGLVRVRLIAYCFNNCSPAAPPPPGCSGPQCDWYIRIEIAEKLGTGPCCGSGPSATSVKGTSICAVDPNDISGC